MLLIHTNIVGCTLVCLCTVLPVVQARRMPHGDGQDKDVFHMKHVGPYFMGDDVREMPVPDAKHGVKMGVKSRACDDGQTNIGTDWDGMNTEETQCNESDLMNIEPGVDRIDEKKAGPSIHICLPEAIIYKSYLPLSGPHRPLWPRFGEYVYLPPQRWVHSLEHGAIALLYQPCVDGSTMLENLKQVVKGCVRKHVITPYRHIPGNRPFALVAFKHAILFSSFDIHSLDDVSVVTSFIREYGLKAPESHVTEDGQYSVGLIHAAKIVSDVSDRNVCPGL